MLSGNFGGVLHGAVPENCHRLLFFAAKECLHLEIPSDISEKITMTNMFGGFCANVSTAVKNDLFIRSGHTVSTILQVIATSRTSLEKPVRTGSCFMECTISQSLQNVMIAVERAG